MGANIGIGIANAIGFKHTFGRGGDITPKPIAAWSAAGKTNEDEDRAVLKDLTGNGHDITLNGFAFSKMSGYGGYNYNYRNWTNSVNAEINGNIAIINGYPSTRKVFEKHLGKTTPITILRLRVNIEIKNNPNNLPINMFFTGAEDNPDININVVKSGIYEIPQIISNACKSNGYYVGFQINNNGQLEGDENYYCKIELLPEYPDALVFDGVNDYTSYIPDFPKDLGTIIIDIQQLKDNVSTMLFGTPREGDIVSWGGGMYIRDTGIRLMTYPFAHYYDKLYKNKYNRQIITFGWDNNSGIKYGWINYESDKYIKNFVNYKTLYAFGRDFNSTEYAKMAFYSAYLFDRSLTEEEIKTFIRKNIDPDYVLPSEQETTE